MDEAEKHDLRFSQQISARYETLADENGPIYDSRRGLAGYYRYNPCRVERLSRSDEVTTGKPKIHESVLRRIEVGQDGYPPIAVPPDFDVVRINGEVLTFDDYLDQLAAKKRITRRKPLAAVKADFAKQREHTWNWVWWRRIAYYFTLVPTLFLLAFPMLWPIPSEPDDEAHRFFLIEAINSFTSGAIDLIALLLPGFTADWTDAYSSRPGMFLILVVPVALGLQWGGVLQQRMRDAMRAVWYNIPELNPRPDERDWAAKPAAPGH
jgi:hypothetical protein